MTTGFFLADSRGELVPARVLRMLRKVLWLTLVANVLYFVFRYLSESDYQRGVRSFAELMRLVWYGDTISLVLWYFTALWEGLLIIWLFLRCKMSRCLYVWIPIGILMWLVIGRYADVVGYTWQTDMLSSNVFTAALPCIMLGVVCRRYEPHIVAYRNLLPICLICVAGALWYEWHFIPYLYGGECYIFTIPLAVLAFCVAMVFDASGILKPFVWMGTYLTTALYLLHIPVAHGLCKCIWGRPYTYFQFYPLEWFTWAVIGVTLLLALVWYFGVRLVRRF